jgi:hypothetical protein
MFIFIFLCCFLTTERVYCKIREIATFLEAVEFRSIFTTIKYVLDNIINVTPDNNSLFQLYQIISF